ncbi:MAG: 2-hydroxyacid dehydrogenase [Alphaproteobacteria bacterium]|jgi:glyoxylate reductase/D-3-phosphoglycerate dehydrogenase|nr:2-hydroxyacid dehydrogenase [Alphaproteobacteria bacterium]
MAPKILFVSEFPDAEGPAQALAPDGFDFVLAPEDSAEYRDALGKAEYLIGFVDRLVDDALFDAAPNLKLIQLLSAGYNRADLAAARRARVPIANNGGANAVAVSEHALMLMLACSRQLNIQHANVGAGRWHGNAFPRIFELRGKTLGIVGLGNIGKRTARLAAAFGLRILYYDIDRLNEDEEDALGVRFRLLRELLGESDFVSLHVPLNDGTWHLMSADRFALMKPSAILINTSRGPVVDEVALTTALTDGKIAGAGLDVFEQEPPDPDNPLFTLDTVVLSAHLAGGSRESGTTRVRNAFDNVERVARGAAPMWLIPELQD